MPFVIAWLWGLSSTPTHHVKKPSSGPPAGFQGWFPYWFCCKSIYILILSIKKKNLATFTPEWHYLSKWMRCGNEHFPARPWFQGLSYALSIFESLYTICKGIWRIFLFGKIRMKKVKVFSLNLTIFSCWCFSFARRVKNQNLDSESVFVSKYILNEMIIFFFFCR